MVLADWSDAHGDILNDLERKELSGSLYQNYILYPHMHWAMLTQDTQNERGKVAHSTNRM